jgi:hypothetical protein
MAPEGLRLVSLHGGSVGFFSQAWRPSIAAPPGIGNEILRVFSKPAPTLLLAAASMRRSKARAERGI